MLRWSWLLGLLGCTQSPEVAVPEFPSTSEEDATVTTDTDDETVIDTAGCQTAVVCTGDYDISSANNLDEIANCESISGDLIVVDQDWIKGIDLPCLTTIGNDLTIEYNDALPHFDGLSALVSVSGGLWIDSNPALTRVDGMAELTSVGGDVSIYQNPSLCQSFIDTFVAGFATGGNLSIWGNDDGC